MRSIKLRQPKNVHAISLSPTGDTFVTAQSKYATTLRSIADGEVLARIAKDGDARCVRYDPTGEYIVAAYSRMVVLVRITPAGVTVSKLQAWYCNDARFADDGRAVELVMSDGVHNCPLPWPPGGPESMPPNTGCITQFCNQLSPSGKYLTAVSWTQSDTVAIAVTSYPAKRNVGELTTTCRLFSGGVRFCPGDDRVVAVGRAGVNVFDWPPRVPVQLKTPPERRRIRSVGPSVAWSHSLPQPASPDVPFTILPCGTRMLIRGANHRVELRDLTTGQILTEWDWGITRLFCLAVSPDGTIAAAGGQRGQVVLWDLDS